jgi:hypothetical protein
MYLAPFVRWFSAPAQKSTKNAINALKPPSAEYFDNGYRIYQQKFTYNLTAYLDHREDTAGV